MGLEVACRDEGSERLRFKVEGFFSFSQSRIRKMRARNPHCQPAGFDSRNTRKV